MNVQELQTTLTILHSDFGRTGSALTKDAHQTSWNLIAKIVRKKLDDPASTNDNYRNVITDLLASERFTYSRISGALSTNSSRAHGILKKHPSHTADGDPEQNLDRAF